MKKANYVNNKEFTASITAFVKAREEDETITLRLHEKGDYIGHCIMEICKNLAKKANFVNYTYKDEMVEDGIENCIKSSSKFNYEKSTNAFGYFTQIAFNAFIRRIQKEKKQADRKLQLLSDPGALHEIIAKQFPDGPAGSEHGDNIQYFVDQMQNKLTESEQLLDIRQKAPKRKIKSNPESPLSKLLEV